MIAVADIELRPIEAQTQHRAGGDGTAAVGNRAAAQQHVVIRLHIALGGEFPGTVHRHSVRVRHDSAVVVVRDGAGRAGVSHGIVARVALQVPLDLRAQRFVHLACLRQRGQHQFHRKRPLEDGFVRENQHPLDLPFHFGFEIERQVGADAASQGTLRQRGQRGDKHNSGPQCLDPGHHDVQCLRRTPLNRLSTR